MVLQGRVTVDNQVVRDLSTRVNPREHQIALDGQKIHEERSVYYAVHKPKGYVTTNNDPAGKPRVVDLLPDLPQRVYAVGRLDEQSTGLLLLTNDGELANKLAHPRFGVEKIYRVIVAGEPGREVLDQLTQGVWLAEGKVRAKRVRLVGRKGQASVMEMVLAEGKNREIRRMMARLGHKVMSLTRIAVGPIGLKGLGVGEYRPLTGAEIELLRDVAAGKTVPTPRFPDRRERTPRPEGPPRPGRPSVGADSRATSGPGRPGGPPRPPGPHARPPQGGPRYQAGGPRPQGQGQGGPRPDGPPRPQQGGPPRPPQGGPRLYQSGGPRPQGQGQGGPRPGGPRFQSRGPQSQGQDQDQGRPPRPPGPHARPPQGGPRFQSGGPRPQGQGQNQDGPRPGGPPRPPGPYGRPPQGGPRSTARGPFPQGQGQGGPRPQRPRPPESTGDSGPTRRIIGMEPEGQAGRPGRGPQSQSSSGPPPRRPVPKRAPRAANRLKRRPADSGGDEPS
jgi:23S rRNA pseudouridine2605 synthase